MKQRLLIIAPSYTPSLGGVETHLAKTLPLLQRDYDITVLVRYTPGLPRRQVLKGIDVYRLPREWARGLILRSWLKSHQRLWAEVDIVHSHDYFLPYVRNRVSARWVHTFHGYESYPIPVGAKRSRQELNQLVDYRFAVGKFIEKWYDTPCDEILWGASDIVGAATKKPEIDFLFYGRFEKDTGVEEYLEAFLSLYKEHPELTLRMVGDGSLDNALRSRTEGVSAVQFSSLTTDVASHLAQARVALVSGYLAIIEAGRYELPVVSVYTNPLKKDYLKLHPAAKNLYIAGSIEQLQAAMEEAYLQGKTKAKSLARWSRQQTWERLAERYRKAYRSK